MNSPVDLAAEDLQPKAQLWISSLLSIALLVGLAASLLHASGLARKFEDRHLVLEGACAEIRRLDEVLTMEARMAAATGNLAWERRYREDLVSLERAIDEARRLAPSDRLPRTTRDTARANEVLVALEEHAFDLVRRGERERALALFDSQEYCGKKAAYSDGLDAYIGRVRAELDELIQVEVNRSRVGLLALSLLMPVLLTLWFTTIRALREYGARREASIRELEAARERADTANIAKSRFLANMSHEIRTPLNAILGFSDLLLSQESTDEDRYAQAEMIRKSSEHLLELVNDLLDLSKIEANKTLIEVLDVDLRGLVHEVVQVGGAPARDKGLAIEMQWDEAMPRLVRTDPTRVRQVLLNLFSNAVKFTESGAVRLKVQWVDEAHQMIRFAVEDSGIGIPSDRLELVFDRFTQCDESVTRRFGGTGLGLNVSRKLARLMGGDLRATSEVGVGSRFEFTLPYVAPEPISPDELVELPAAALPKRRPARRPAARREVGADSPGSSPHRVLVAEDTPVNQILTRRILESGDHQVEIAADGLEAIEAVERARAAGKSFDLILMDLMMPNLDGLGATERLREFGVSTPIIAFTADALPETRKRCLDAGCDAVLTKPIRKDALLAEVERWVREARL